MLHPRYFLNHVRRIHSNTCAGYIQIHMLDALSRHTVLGKPFIHTNQLKWADPRDCVNLLCVQYGINVFLRVCSAAWYRLAKYIMIQK